MSVIATLHRSDRIKLWLLYPVAIGLGNPRRACNAVDDKVDDGAHQIAVISLAGGARRRHGRDDPIPGVEAGTSTSYGFKGGM
jgi:hypothetical protein